MDRLPGEELRPLQIIAGGLIASAVFFLAAIGLVRWLASNLTDDPMVMYAAIGVALLSPVVAGAMRHKLTAGFAGERQPPEKIRASVMVSFGVLEMAALFCGVALLATPTYWPLLAAVVPLAAMALWFPRQ
jgi:hypothetical protein